MQLSEFLSYLTQHAGQELVFEFPHGAIRKDYHLTEVLRVQVDAIDCGGAVDRWSETVLQLVEPGSGDGTRFMPVDKALAILTRSHDRIPLDPASEVLLEYRPEETSAAQRFHIASIHSNAATLRVSTIGVGTQCKAADRSQTVCGTKTQAAGCCAPAAKDAEAPLESAVKSPARCCA